MLKYIFKISILFLITHTAFAQADKFAPSSFRVGVDAASFLYSVIDENATAWEMEVDIDFYKYFLVADMGFNSFQQTDENFYSYKSSGRYFRLGPEVNFMNNEKTQNVLALGMRYCWVVFDESATYSTYNAFENNIVDEDISDNLVSWPEQTIYYDEDNIRGRWFELTASIKGRVYKNLYLGITARYKVLPSGKKDGTFQAYFIPGFGKRINDNNWGASYYVAYRFPFRKKKQFYFQPTERK